MSGAAMHDRHFVPRFIGSVGNSPERATSGSREQQRQRHRKGSHPPWRAATLSRTRCLEHAHTLRAPASRSPGTRLLTGDPQGDGSNRWMSSTPPLHGQPTDMSLAAVKPASKPPLHCILMRATPVGMPAATLRASAGQLLRKANQLSLASCPSAACTPGTLLRSLVRLNSRHSSA